MSPAAAARPWALVLTCEHGGHDVPEPLASRFAGQQALLESHRGWDPGALQLAQEMAAHFAAPMHHGVVTRLVVDLNRSIGHPRLHSELTRDAPRAQRREWIDRWWRPHRDRVAQTVAERIAAGRRVLHVASHSFTPELHGVVRQADVAWLYDPARPGESAIARRWQQALARRATDLALRRNYPYRGAADGLARSLRRQHADEVYVGVELELNQRFVLAGGEAWERLRQRVIESLEDVLIATPVA